MRLLLLLAAVVVVASALALPARAQTPPTVYSSPAAESGHVFKSSAGNLQSLYVTTGGASGYLMTFDAATIPGDGAVAPKDCILIAANQTVAFGFGSLLPDYYSNGIVAVFSSTGCFNKNASATAFFKGRTQ